MITTPSDREILYIIEQEVRNCQGTSGDDIANDRSRAMDYYHGEMDEYLNTEEDRSNVVSRDVLDAVESTIPSLIKIFMDEENLVAFDPQGPEDEQAAEQETKVVRHIFFEENNGFINLYTFIKDALLSKTGILKAAWEEDQYEREEYKGLNPIEFQALISDQTKDIEVTEYEEVISDDATDQFPPEIKINATIKSRVRAGKVKIFPTPPEEFGISRQATTPNPGDAPFSYHRVKRTVRDLINEGYDKDKIESLPFDDDNNNTEEQIARYLNSDEQFGARLQNHLTRTVWVTEAYVYLDNKDDGIGQLTKVTAAGTSANFDMSLSVLLDKEEVDSVPLFCATPILRTHAFSGLSLADLIMDIQEIRTILIRAIIDNTIATTHQREAINENVNIDDAMTKRPNGIVRVEGEAPPAQSIQSLQQPQLPGQTFELMNLLEDTIRQRTGVGDEVQGLDTSALSNVNTGVIMAALEQSRMRIMLMARVIAETGLRPLFQHIHSLTKKNNSKPLTIKLNGEWTPINPSEWTDRTNISVNIGIGRETKEVKLAMLNSQLQQQMQMLQAGLPMVNPQNIYSTLASITKLTGGDPAMSWVDPSTLPPPPPPQPDPNIVLQQQMLQFQAQQHQDLMAVKQAELQSNAAQGQAKIQAEIQKANIGLEKVRIDEQSEVINAQARASDAVLSAEMKRQEQVWKQEHEATKLEMEKYKADLAALTTLIKDIASEKTVSYLEGEISE